MPHEDSDKLLKEIEFVFVDVETTGLYPVYGDRICELGALKVKAGQEVGMFDRLIDPGRPISPGAAAVNKITEDMVRGQPTFALLAPEFMSFIEGSVLVAHNAPFDLGFLTTELRLSGLPLPRNRILDTLTIARRYLNLPSHSLGSLARHYQIMTPDAHRALGDCRTTFQVFLGLVDSIFPGSSEPSFGEFLDMVSGWTVEGQEADPLNLLPPALRGPVKRREPVVIDYVNASGYKSRRKIRLKEVLAECDYVYLVAYCYEKQSERTFRLDRILHWESVPDDDSPFGTPIDQGIRDN